MSITGTAPEPLILEQSVPGRRGYQLPLLPWQGPLPQLPPGMTRQADPVLPQVSELQVARHYTRLSQLNYGVESGFYPLGSCTMKYNPVVLEEAARQPGFSQLHPEQPSEDVQGALRLLYELAGLLAEIGGVDRVDLQPAAGAHGELAGLLVIKAYLQARGEEKRTKVLVPDSAHGTNPASASMAGFQVVQVDSGSNGQVDPGRLAELAGEDTAALMLTNPNTLGIFEEKVQLLADTVHRAGGLMYYDGANLNALLGRSRPGDMGFDVMHFNLHKTFGAPHGGGGPGAGPIGVKSFLAPFLPGPLVAYDQESRWYYWEQPQHSLGRVKAFFGNFLVLVKAYTYLRALGAAGLAPVSGYAVLNANYLRQQLAEDYPSPHPGGCAHEFVVQPGPWLPGGLHTLDIAKRLMDYGFHPSTIYFPLLVGEAMMVEPTETEDLATLDSFARALKAIARECREEPQTVASAPHHTAVGRLDEVAAARRPILAAPAQGKET